MAFTLSQASLDKLKGVHPDLVKVVTHALQLSPIDFMITEGLRTLARQKELVAKGASQTMHSRHITGHAVDLAALPNGKLSWVWADYETLNKAMQAAAKDLKVPIEWGGSWKTLKDGPHFQLPFAAYP